MLGGWRPVDVVDVPTDAQGVRFLGVVVSRLPQLIKARKYPYLRPVALAVANYVIF